MTKVDVPLAPYLDFIRQQKRVALVLDHNGFHVEESQTRRHISALVAERIHEVLVREVKPDAVLIYLRCQLSWYLLS